ncbi:MAG: hypothetical protein WD114_01375 [Phycisphaerales bacterium]
MKRVAFFSAIALSALMVGCSSTQTRDGKDCCEGDKAECCMMQCDHANTAFECPNCEPGKPCCAGCAAKAAAMCPDCEGKDSAKACGDCKDKKTAHACPDCKDGQACAKCQA